MFVSFNGWKTIVRLGTHSLLLISTIVGLWANDYSDGVAAASQVRYTLQDPSVFARLTLIDPSQLTMITVDDGTGGQRTIAAVKVTTLTSFTSPYQGAQPLQRFQVDTTGHFRANIWVTLGGALGDYYRSRGLPITDNATVAHHMLQASGMPGGSGYEALTFYVEPKYVTRPSFNPSISTLPSPEWDGDEYTFTDLASLDPSFWGFAPTVEVGGVYQRPFSSFEGISEYTDWHSAWSSVSYDTGGDRAFPFTGVGWTWNWNPDPNLNGFALSEFLVSGNAEFYFDSLQSPIGLVPEPHPVVLLMLGGLVGAVAFFRRR